MPETATASPPLSALLDCIETLLRAGPAGVPDFTTAAWPSGKAPANHFLVPKGTQFYRGDECASRVVPCLLVWNHAKATRAHENLPLFWNIPITVQLRLDRSIPHSALNTLSENLELLLLADFTTQTAGERLSSPAIRTRNIFDTDVSPFNEHEGETVVQVVFTAFCSGLNAAAVPAE